MKLTKLTILLSIVILFSITNNLAQIRIEVPEKDVDVSVCGKIENEKLTIPSYKFKILDNNGKSVEKLQAVGTLGLSRSTWLGGVFDKDAYWETKSFSIDIPIVFDSNEGVYTSQEVSKIKIEKRKIGGVFGRSCLDRVEKMTFDFYLERNLFNYFVYFFPNKKINKVKLPNNQKVIVIEKYLK